MFALPAQAADISFANGIWVNTEDMTCATAEQVSIYTGAKNYTIYFYGPNHSMGPQFDTNNISKVTPGKNGYTRVTDDVMDYDLKLSPDGKLQTRMTIGWKGGYDTSVTTSQKCALSSLPQKMRDAITRLVPDVVAGTAQTTAPGATPVTTASSSLWSATPENVAIYDGRGGIVQAIILSCNAEGTANIVMQLKSSFKQQSIQVNFVSPITGNFPATIAYSPEYKLWAGGLDSPLVETFINAQSLSVQLPGQAVQQISLSGSGKAIRTAMQACLYGSPPGSGPAVAPFGLASGYYVQEGGLCTDPSSIYYYDGKRFGMLSGNAPDPLFPNDPRGELYPIGKPKKAGKVWNMNDGSSIEPTSTTRFIFTYEEGVPVRWCPTEQIPVYARVK